MAVENIKLYYEDDDDLVREPEVDDDIIILEEVTGEINSGDSGVLFPAPTEIEVETTKKENNSLKLTSS